MNNTFLLTYSNKKTDYNFYKRQRGNKRRQEYKLPVDKMQTCQRQVVTNRQSSKGNV